MYVALAAVLVATHEGWRDEADSWLMVRDAPLAHIPTILGRAGTPMLWYALLVPFARAGLPYLAQFVLHALIAIAAVAVLLRDAPFRMPLKLLIVFSYFLGFEYLAVARSYALMILLLFLMAQRYRKPELPLLLALFMNTTVHALLIGIGIAAVVAWETRRWKPITIMMIGALVAALPIVMARGEATVDPFGIVRWKGPLQAMAGAFMPTIGVRRMFLVGMAAFIAAAWALRKDIKALLILAWSWAALFFIYTFVYIGDLRHFGLLLMTVLFALWIGRPQTMRAVEVILYCSLILSTAVAVSTWQKEITQSFSGSKEMARHLDGNQTIAAHPPPMAEAVLAYLPRTTRFWYPPLQRFGTYMEWDARQLTATDVPNDVAAAQALRRFPHDDHLLILTAGPLADPQRLGLELVYMNGTPVWAKKDETYFLYRIATAR
ncbi:MAG TPA: hypothetical protein VJ276_16265 [Thermoanaerobaculia bacterium]|nr:hypothetical protein [Thermoanaerobaculia bacterium]